ncbi:toll/interleukin-1 receptor domain-containing protein [Bradyrhizobium betae]
MTKRLFLSYSSKDETRAIALERSLEALKLPVSRDERSISPGTKWFDAIEKGVRDLRGVIVLVTKASRLSEWVIYEYSLARGAGIPVIAVLADGKAIPDPLQPFQAVKHDDPDKVAEKIKKALADQSRAIGRNRASSAPVLHGEISGKRMASPSVRPRAKRLSSVRRCGWSRSPNKRKASRSEIPDRGDQGQTNGRPNAY